MKNNFFFKKQFSNIYKKASKNSEVTSQILYGEKFKILSKNKEWVKIKSSFDNYIGYIKNKDYVEKLLPNYKVYSLKAKIFTRLNKNTKPKMPNAIENPFFLKKLITGPPSVPLIQAIILAIKFFDPILL